ncbi:MAG TPA: stage II sporulation protein M [Thermomicrobiales bacterium]|nr:stage II sporulation protein M [Thermomicrobiales bacterium]
MAANTRDAFPVIDEFVAARRARWERLEALIGLARGRKGSRLSADELEQLGRLYRQTTSDLAIARRDFPRDRVTRYLESLVSRGHPVVYQPEAREWSSVGRFFSQDFPRAFRESWRFTLVAFALFAIPFALAMFGTLIDPTIGRVVMPPSEFVDQVERGESWLEIEREQRPFFASLIATNNIQVTFLAFAGGALFGLGTVYVLVNNGLMIGAVAGLATAHGLGGDLLGFVSPHGGIELTVIFIAGGAGLRIGHALLRPGFVTRRAALAAAAQRAIVLMGGCVPLLLLTGAIEGFVSPSGLPLSAKLAIGAFNLMALFAYLLLAGRGAEEPRAARLSMEPSPFA